MENDRSKISFDAVFENGILRPLAPLALREHTRVRLVIAENGEEALLEGFVNSRPRPAGEVPSLEMVRNLLTKIPGSLSAACAAEREER